MIYQFSFLDLLPYFFMTVFLTAIMRNNSTLKKKAFACFVLMFVFSAIRYGIGYDYFGYKAAALHQVKDYTINRFEPLSRLLIEIGYHTHYQVFFILCSFLTLYPLYKACLKLSINPAYSLVVYFLFPNFYLESFSIVRNAIAYSFALYSFVLLNDKKLIKSILMVAIAFLFHKSSVIIFLFYPLFGIKSKAKTYIIFYVISFVASQTVMLFVARYADIIPFVSDLENYAEHARSQGGTMTYVINAMTIFNFIIWKKLEKLSPINGKYLALFCIGTCLWNVFLPIDSTIALRLSSFFQIFIIFLVPQYKYAFNNRLKRMVSLCTFSFFLIFFMSYFYINVSSYLKTPDRMSNIPYQTIFIHTDYSNYVY